MPLVSMGPMLRHARANGYAIAAYNMIDYNSARAIVDAAVAKAAPVIVQVSVKTVRHWGYAPIAGWLRMLADEAPVPVALHLDHCTDLDVLRRCIEAGWTSVMFDGSALPFEKNLEMSLQAYAMTQRAGVGLEAEIGAIGGVEDDKVVDEDASRLADFDECVRFVGEMPDLAVFAPAIGTAHGFYKGEPNIAYDLLERITAALPVPIALHGGTGLSEEQFRRCIGYGCGKVNISTMHKRLFIEGFTRLKAEKPTLEEPLPFIAAQHNAMAEDVAASIDLFGSAGRAAELSDV
ncbi:class II fructose-bisphosphate aldolase [Pikeienuella piscinae]|uniref:Class II fructose-bisphosphate aldolase n=1 Tax=Pikeienuella piscinae TaxID=2748098 RepID=A0A7L5BYL8_9RHOB|nr:class II fructose-bisphosphate aldolase [Pikeienuella piscinae]QIE54984.1 class II fructose-bisphosphate aldolase [Pikeienuella piscinae]